MISPLEEVAFWAQIFDDAKRTVYCNPELESRAKGHIDALQMGGIFEVIATPNMPEDQVLVVDTQALEAEMSKPIRLPRVQMPEDWCREPLDIYFGPCFNRITSMIVNVI